MSTFTIPGVGPVQRKWVYVGGAVVAGAAGFMWLRRQQTASAPVADPALGSLGATGEYVNPAPDSGGGAPVGIPSGTAPTDAAWVEDVAQRLSMTWEASFVINTLGRWMSGQPLTQEEANLIRAALALRGNPPSGARPIILVTAPATPAPTTPSPTQPAPTVQQPYRYTVKSGDTLSRIATLYGVSVTALYQANRDLIESTARQHGMTSSNNGWWIYPPTVLTIPR